MTYNKLLHRERTVYTYTYLYVQCAQRINKNKTFLCTFRLHNFESYPKRKIEL